MKNLRVGFPKGISSEITERNPEMVPVVADDPPFGFGSVVALFVHRADAERFVAGTSRYVEVTDRGKHIEVRVHGIADCVSCPGRAGDGPITIELRKEEP